MNKLEHYLSAVLPFGGRHADGMDQDDDAEALGKDLALVRERWRLGLQAPDRKSLAMTLHIDPDKVKELVGLIAKGPIWHHWKVLLLPATTGIRAEALGGIGYHWTNVSPSLGGEVDSSILSGRTSRSCGETL